MAKYEIYRRTSATQTEKVTLPIDTIDGLQPALDSIIPANIFIKKIVLDVGFWTDNTQIVSVSGVTESNTVIVGANGDPKAYAEAGIYCLEQTQGSLTFACATPPTQDISVNILVINVYTKSLEDYTWEEIAQISANGLASTKWSVGDTKTITLSTGEVVKARIIGFNHDDLADGTGKAGITFDFENCLETTRVIDSDLWTFGWTECSMRTVHANEIFSQLPVDLQGAIKTVTKKNATSGRNDTVALTDDKLFLLSVGEIYGTTYHGPENSYTNIADVGDEQYEYFANSPIPNGRDGFNNPLTFTGLNGDRGTFYSTHTSGSAYFTSKQGSSCTASKTAYSNYNASKGLGHAPTASVEYWLRSSHKDSQYTGKFSYVSKSATIGGQSSSSNKYGVAFAFCV